VAIHFGDIGGIIGHQGLHFFSKKKPQSQWNFFLKNDLGIFFFRLVLIKS
jgi:hypothetical protein